MKFDFLIPASTYFDASDQNVKLPDSITKEKDQTEKRKLLLCRSCGHAISSEEERIQIGNQHFHTFSNPSGIVFDIGCFRNAPGCTEIGPSTFEHTWFSGHQWKIALCSHCREHLGWLFTNSDNFYGLIIPRLSPG